MIVLLVLFVYFLALLAVGRWSSRRGGNDAFFRGGRQSPWRMVAFGMVGASISGVTFLSVPGMVLSSGMTYLQLCLGFILGYLAVAFVLLPVYYRLNLTSVYAYLGRRLGTNSYLTGAAFFLLSKMTGTAVKFYVACFVVHQFVAGDGYAAAGRGDLTFAVVTAVMVLLIWLYTHKGGVRTLVFTDTLQTLCLLTTLVLIIVTVTRQTGLSAGDAVRAIAADERSRIFVFGEWASPQNFWKMLLSGAFIVVVMTGLDQDMMQKNLTCRTLREAQKNMCSYGVAFVPVNLLFLSLGVLLARHFECRGISLPAQGDQLLPMFISHFPVLLPLFVLGIVAASFSSADSALTALTTSYCVDIRRRPLDEGLRRRTHAVMCTLLAVGIVAIRAVNSSSLIDAIYTIVSYTYGPLLGLFAYGLFTRRSVNDRLVPAVCILSPLVCFGIDTAARHLAGYRWGYELLLLNGLITFMGLWATAQTGKRQGGVLLPLLCLACCTACSPIRPGDLLFHEVEQPNHITSVTNGAIDHVAVCLSRDAVVEAIPGEGVVITPMASLLQREPGRYFRGRVKGASRKHSVRRALDSLGLPYDTLFLPGNEAVYCSELVVRSFVDRHGRPLLEQTPMTFTDSTGSIPAYWQQLYARHGMNVPQGEPGSNPAELSRRKGIKLGGRKLK